MLELAEKTPQEKLEALKQEVGKAFFDYGRIKYEIEVKEKELGNISVNIHNLNHKCIALNEAVEKEAKKAALEMKLAPPSRAPRTIPRHGWGYAMSWFKRENESLRDELTEKRALPVGVTEFHEWSDRIISGAMLTSTPESQKFALANLLLNLQPTIAFEADVYFIHCLRKTAVNQVAEAMRQEIRAAAKARLLAQEALEAQQNQAEATAPAGANAEVLENRTV